MEMTSHFSFPKGCVCVRNKHKSKHTREKVYVQTEADFIIGYKGKGKIIAKSKFSYFFWVNIWISLSYNHLKATGISK